MSFIHCDSFRLTFVCFLEMCCYFHILSGSLYYFYRALYIFLFLLVINYLLSKVSHHIHSFISHATLNPSSVLRDGSLKTQDAVLVVFIEYILSRGHILLLLFQHGGVCVDCVILFHRFCFLLF